MTQNKVCDYLSERLYPAKCYAGETPSLRLDIFINIYWNKVSETTHVISQRIMKNSMVPSEGEMWATIAKYRNGLKSERGELRIPVSADELEAVLNEDWYDMIVKTEWYDKILRTTRSFNTYKQEVLKDLEEVS